ncbi:MAG TPA: GTPase HflX [Acidobacteriaceae bacterium]|nr:GTPase HflX [Acidobacteriaceae bacterium]
MTDLEKQCRSTFPARNTGTGERTIIVACEFTGRKYRQKLTASARLAKGAFEAMQGPSADVAADTEHGNSSAEVSESDAGPLSGELPARSSQFALSPEAAECRELAESAGADVLDVMVQRRDHPDPATLVGKGKLEEIGARASASQADLIVFEQDLSPSQLRELERLLPCRVIDRTQLILDIFASHARTREGQLQVELAQLEYMLPRLAGRGRSMSQLGGGIGTRGPGETQLETDRRKIGRKIQIVKARLASVRSIRQQQRQRRESVPVPTVALVGYTNAGKSTLFNALTRAEVLESARLFATLDPKLHVLTLRSRRRILLSDTVGFIRALPHTLVNAFRATLEEVQMAEVLIHVMDASSESLASHREEVEKVLKELNVADKPRIEIMNKCDLLPGGDERASRWKAGAIAVSARNQTGLDKLLLALDEALKKDPLEEREMSIPQSEGGVLAALDAGAVVLQRDFHDDMVCLRVRGPASLMGKYRMYWVEEQAPHA